MADMVNVLIDGKPIAVEKGTLVIEAARRLGIMVPHFCYHPKLVYQKEFFSPLIEKEMNRCVSCLRCVRYCDQVMDVKALGNAGRSTMTEIVHFAGHQLDCEFCGGCVQICPVGAITSRLSMYEFRPWMMKRADTTCGYCGDGCTLILQTRDQ